MLDFASQKRILEPILKHSTNHICADCDTRSPTWASLDFGVFLCSNCSGAHRALGPTITRVKSANLDLWQEEWVTYMVLGNEQINNYWESDMISKVKKPTMGSSPEEIRRYVFDKYVKKRYVKNPTEDDPLSSYKKGGIVEPNEKKQQKAEEQQQYHQKEEPKRQNPVNLPSVPQPKSTTSQQKKQISLLDFDIELNPPPVALNEHEEEQFTTYTECATSFTNESSKDNFVDFNSLLQSHKQNQAQIHHSMSTQAVFQHALYNNQPPYNHPQFHPQNQIQHQNYPSFTHQNYFHHPYPPNGHFSPVSHINPIFTPQNTNQYSWKN